GEKRKRKNVFNEIRFPKTCNTKAVAARQLFKIFFGKELDMIQVISCGLNCGTGISHGFLDAYNCFPGPVIFSSHLKYRPCNKSFSGSFAIGNSYDQFPIVGKGLI